MAKRTKKRNRRHDAAFKNLHAFPLMAWGLMEIALAKELFEELDFDTLERLPAEWIGPGLERRLGDAVWRVERRGGGSLIVPVEFQRKRDRWMPLRVAAYLGLMLENLARRGELDPDGRLPLVQPVVLYNGLRPWRGPTGVAGLSAGGGPEWPRFALVDMGRIRVEDLPGNNAAALQIEVHQGALARDADAVLGRLSALLGGPAHRELRVAFAEWIWHSLAPGMGPEAPRVPGLIDRLREIAELGEFEEMKKSFMLQSMVDHWLEQGMARGMAQGVEQGMARGVEQGMAQGMAQGMERGVTEGVARARADERARLCRLAGRKFGGRAAARLSARIDGVTDPERLAEVGDWIIDCGTEAEFLARAERAGDRDR